MIFYCLSSLVKLKKKGEKAMELKEGDAKLFARYIAQDIMEYFKTEEHRKEFEEYYFEKYGEKYVWKVGI